MRLGLSSKSADGDSDAEYMSRLIDAQSPTDIYVRRVVRQTRIIMKDSKKTIVLTR